jgi:hypothetical protein
MLEAGSPSFSADAGLMLLFNQIIGIQSSILITIHKKAVKQTLEAISALYSAGCLISGNFPPFYAASHLEQNEAIFRGLINSSLPLTRQI